MKPDGFKLSQNYPNPFNPSTNIRFDIGKPGMISLKVHDVTGKLVDILIDEFKNAGSYTLSFNGRNLPSGVYFYTLTSTDFSETKKMIMMK